MVWCKTKWYIDAWGKFFLLLFPFIIYVFNVCVCLFMFVYICVCLCMFVQILYLIFFVFFYVDFVRCVELFFLFPLQFKDADFPEFEKGFGEKKILEHNKQYFDIFDNVFISRSIFFTRNILGRKYYNI